MSHIYKITNLINGKIYVGKSLHPKDDYYGSGLQISGAIAKYGKENFSKTVLEECSPDNLDTQEIMWIEKLDARNPAIGYNISIGGTGGNHYWKSLNEDGKIQLRDKISKAKTGATINYTDEQRTNVKDGLAKFWQDKKTDTEWLKSRAPTKKYVISDGITFIRIENLSEYCLIHKLSESSLCSLATGNAYNPVKGLYCFYDVPDKEVLDNIKMLEEKQKQVRDGFMKKAQNRPRYECAYCGVFATKSNLTRWHNDNCKKK